MMSLYVHVLDICILDTTLYKSYQPYLVCLVSADAAVIAMCVHNISIHSILIVRDMFTKYFNICCVNNLYPDPSLPKWAYSLGKQLFPFNDISAHVFAMAQCRQAASFTRRE